MYWFPDSIFQMRATKQVGPFAARPLTFQAAFTSRPSRPRRPACRALGKGWEPGGRQVRRYLLEGLLSSVGADVVVEGGGPGKGTATVAALERPVAGVRDHVVPQFGRLGEGLGAVAALVRSETQREAAWSLLPVAVSGKRQEAKATALG